MARASAGRIEDRDTAVNGVRLHYRETSGAGGPLLCLHGITSNARAWDGLALELAPEYRVLAPDLRGRGDSDKPFDDYGLATHAADVVALLDRLPHAGRIRQRRTGEDRESRSGRWWRLPRTPDRAAGRRWR